MNADEARCPGSGAPGQPAPQLEDGFPDGLALCKVCFGFVPLVEDALAVHDSWRGDETRELAAKRRDWMNSNGW